MSQNDWQPYHNIINSCNSIEVNGVKSKPKLNRDQIAEKFNEFFDINSKDGTYVYNLTRVKEAFGYGTMTIEDFEEVDEVFIYELADFILDNIQ